MKLAEKMFAGFAAESELSDKLSDAGMEIERLGFDEYDASVELHGVPPDQRLSVEAQRIVHAAGFWSAFVNHTDKWQTHYHFKPDADFVESRGWRVCYPHDRGPGETGIWVEAIVEGWPKDWFESGYAIVKSPTPVTQLDPGQGK